MPNRNQLPVIIFTGPQGESDPERWVAGACRANTADLIERATQVPCLRPILLAAPAGAWDESLARFPIELVADPPDGPFHFGRRLKEIVARYRLPRFLYMGGGTGALMDTAELAGLAAQALRLERAVLTNNLFSTDFAAVAPASALDSIEPPDADNDLAWRLHKSGLPVESLPASAATRLDLDTPNDLLVAAQHPSCGPRLRRFVAGLPLDTSRLRRIVAEMRSPRGEVLVYGRVGSAVWARLERLPCQTRVFAEERGMRASGRLARGQVYAWLGAFLEQAGAQPFFASLARSCTAALLDTRPLFAHLRLWPAASDRFFSDLLQPERIADPTIRAFTEAALAASVPIMLGGQALVSGDLLALAEISEEA